jgi:hypothetical protein
MPKKRLLVAATSLLASRRRPPKRPPCWAPGAAFVDVNMLERAINTVIHPAARAVIADLQDRIAELEAEVARLVHVVQSLTDEAALR